jgi:hypothetical protein
VDGKAYSQPLEVKMDPRVKATKEDLDAQFQTASKLAEGMNTSYAALQQARSVGSQLDDAAKKAPKGGLADSIVSASEEVGAFDGSAGDKDKKSSVTGFDKIHGNFAQLYNIANGADAAPTGAVKTATAETEEQLAASEKAWKDWKDSSLAKLNEKLKAASLADIDPSRKVEAMPDDGGEDEE